MKKSKTDFEQVSAILEAKRAAEPAGSVSGLLLELFGKLNSEGSARGLRYMLAYYGLGNEEAQTLEAIGENLAGGLTRERVRQVIDHCLNSIVKLESAQEPGKKPYEKTIAAFGELMKKSELKFSKLEDFEKELDLGSIAEDKKGLISFLNDAGIRQVVYREEHYVYPEGMARNDAITMIQANNKKARRAKTVEKMQSMSKTVTYVPLETREHLLRESEKQEIALNRMYENILREFMEQKPYKDSGDFVKTQSWKARRGKAEWCQVGIYIEKEVFDQVKACAKAVSPTAISNMAYICQAFIWDSKRK